MKKTVLLAATAWVAFSFCPPTHLSSSATTPAYNDSTKLIQHQQDGNAAEWPREKFTEDKETSLLYAVDNDSKNLYIALIIPHAYIQMKMMRMGMTLYVDPKGKKKEGKGIEFPVKHEGEGGFGGGGFQGGRQAGGDPQSRNRDLLAMRTAMATQQLTFLKIFGFEGPETIVQTLDMTGNIQVAFKCDTTEEMDIEYTIPLSLLGKTADLLKQPILGIGCKINGVEMQAAPAGGADAGGGAGGRGASGGRGGSGGRGRMGGSGGANVPTGADRDKMMQELKLWSKYTLTGI